jgi:excisionase family DNA binding protein
MLTLGQAARLTGTSKTTLTRAIKAGRLSATRREDGGYEIDPAELSRVYAVTPATPETGAETGGVVRRATGESDPLRPHRDGATGRA